MTRAGLKGRRQSVPDAKRELFRVTFARSDFQFAKLLCGWLQGEGVPSGGEFHFAVWTALAVTYARPFTKSSVGALGNKPWRQFGDRRLKAAHQFLLSERNRTFAHTDVMPGVWVYVFPPGAFTADGTTTVARVPIAREVVADASDLCDCQIDRATKRVTQLVQRLYGGRDWLEGETFELEHPDFPDLYTIRTER